jgi:hypothetical protein
MSAGMGAGIIAGLLVVPSASIEVKPRRKNGKYASGSARRDVDFGSTTLSFLF